MDNLRSSEDIYPHRTMRESCLVSFSIKPLTSFPHIFLKGRIDVQIAPTGLELMSTHCLSNVMFGYGSMRSCIYVNLNLCMCVHILQERKSSKQILLSKKNHNICGDIQVLSQDVSYASPPITFFSVGATLIFFPLLFYMWANGFRLVESST